MLARTGVCTPNCSCRGLRSVCAATARSPALAAQCCRRRRRRCRQHLPHFCFGPCRLHQQGVAPIYASSRECSRTNWSYLLPMSSLAPCHRLQAVSAGSWGALPSLPVPLGETAAGILINPKNGANWLVVVGEGGCSHSLCSRPASSSKPCRPAHGLLGFHLHASPGAICAVVVQATEARTSTTRTPGSGSREPRGPTLATTQPPRSSITNFICSAASIAAATGWAR